MIIKTEILPNIRRMFWKYVMKGELSSRFLRKILMNDLVGSVITADSASIENLRHIVWYAYNFIPGICWGNKRKIDTWVAHRGILGEPDLMGAYEDADYVMDGK
jgi:hypothetical protein